MSNSTDLQNSALINRINDLELENQRLKELNLLFEQTNSAAKIGAWEINLVGNKIFWSKVVREIHEVPDDYVPELDSAIAFFKDEKSNIDINKAVKDAIEKQKPYSVELILHTFKGNDVWVVAQGSPEIKDGKVVKLYGTFQNIDDRKKQEIALLNTENKYKSIIDHTNNAFFLTKPDGTILEANQAAQELFGYTNEEIKNLGRNGIIDINHPNLPELLRTRAEFGKAQGELAGIKKDGTIFPILISSTIFYNGIGELQTSMSIVDISETRNAQIALIQKNKELEQFAYGASHDLKEPLRMIFSFMEIINKKYADNFDEKGKKYINFAIDGAKRMSILIDELLIYARIGASNQEKEKVDTKLILDDVLNLQKAIIDKNNVEIKVGELPIINGVKTGIKLLFNNIISNALKYHKDDQKPIINIDSTENSSHWIFSIKDNGIGIKKDYFVRIFELFKRLHSQEEYQGTGLGLAACKKTVEQLEGDIWLESEVGVGSTFYFSVKK